jgi:ATP-dependent helicase/nuclease subunit A
VDRVREVVEDGGGLLAAADALDEEEVSNEAEALPLRPGRRDVVRLMNLHKAKGLEAPVVFLADAGHAFEFGTTVRVVREGSRARGHLRVVRTVDEKPWITILLGEPADWATHEQEEDHYRKAEQLRLLYVAGTRAKDLLVVCRTNDARKNKAWGAFDSYLRTMPDLQVPSTPKVPKREAPDLSAAAREEADAQRLSGHDGVRQASWAVMTPTGAKAAGLAAEPVARALSAGEAGAPPAETSSRRGDAGAAWGTLVHGLLEHAMRHETATQADLERLARWLTMEQPDLRPVIPKALDLVEAVKHAPFWDEARAGGEVHAEVPFAVRVEPGTSVPGVAIVEKPTVLRGVIDLVFLAADGWHILHYKMDRLEGVEDPQAELQRRYGTQVGQYQFAWERVNRGRIGSAGVVMLRRMGTTSGDCGR